MKAQTSRPFYFVLAFAWTFAAAVLLVGTLQLLGTFVPRTRTDMVTLGAVEALVFMVATFALLRVHAPDRELADALGVRISSLPVSLLGFGLGLALHGPAQTLELIVERFSPTPSDVLALRAELYAASGPLGIAALILVVVCLVPLVEELFFRGALFGRLAAEHSPRLAMVVCALCFTFSRPDPRAFPTLLLVASTLSYLRLTSGSVLPCVALHVGFNATEIAAVVTGATPLGAAAPQTPAMLIVGWIGSVLLLVAVQYATARSDEAQRAREQDE